MGKGGDVHTFSAFFEENYSLVLAVAEHRLASRHDAEEVATDTFRIAWERYSVGEALNVPWLYGVLRNVIGNEYRSRDRRSALREKIGEQAVFHGPDDHDPYGDVREAVERLPVEHREILKMTYWEDLKGPEVAAVLGLSATAVRSRLLRARRLLKAELAQESTQREALVTSHG